MEQLSLFDYQDFKITKPIRLIELFAGYGSQALALKYLGVNFKHYKICEWAIPSIQAYKDVHFPNTNEDYSENLTKEELVDILFNKGISMNYNESMKKEQINRLSEEQIRNIYNNIITTNNLVNIQQVKGIDLEIVDTNIYTYICTYSFPCQDLSLAGKGAGMKRDSGTRSGMLWEVERILEECKKNDSLPQVLLMENVPQVIGQKNIKDFQSWVNKLESLGYSNFIECLNAKNFGIPQNRDRCFMISILGEYNYTFPKPIELKSKLKDLLENDVDEKYFLTPKQIDDISRWNAYEKPLEHIDDEIVGTLTTRSGAYAASMKLVSDNSLMIKNNTKKGFLDASVGDGIDISSRMSHHRGTVQKEMCQTLTTSGVNDREVVVRKTMKEKLCNELIINGIVKENDVVNHSFTNGLCGRHNSKQNLEDYIETNNNTSSTLTTRPDVLGVCVKDTINYIEWKEKGKLDVDCRAYKEEKIGPTLTTKPNSKVLLNSLRIRKLTPLECFRLMGVKDEDFRNIAKNQSANKLYHLAGDSIVTQVLSAIFKQLF